MSLRSRLAAPLVVSLALLLHARAAQAGNEAAAEALFAEAKKLIAQGKYAEACPKFAESNRLDRGAGTLIHLADCYEKNKQSASAWAAYKEAASAAQALNRADWEKLANKRAAALEPRLAKIVVKVQEPAPKLEIKRDGEALTQASFGVPLPVDVGTHAFQAAAPGYKPFSTSVTIDKDGETKDVVIPKLEVDTTAAPAAETPAVTPAAAGATSSPEAPPVKEGSGGGSQRTLGFVVGGLGLAGVAVGAVTGLMAISKNDASKELCPNDGACASRQGVDDNDSAKTFGLVSTIAFAAGAVGIGAGAVLILTAPAGDKRSGAVRLVPQGSARGGGLALLGTF